MDRWRSARVSLPIALAIVTVLALGLVIDARRTVVLSRGGVVARRIDASDVPHGSKVQAGVDDLELASDAIRIVVGGSRATRERRLSYGVLVDVTASTWEADFFRSLRSVLFVGDRVVEPVTTAVRAALAPEAPLIEVTAYAASEQLAIKTQLGIAPGQARVEIVSELKNVGSEAKDVRIGDRVSWPGGPTFVPSVGDIETDVRTDVGWFGRRARDMAYALVYPDAPVRANFYVSARATNQTAWSAPRRLAAGESYVFRRVLLASWRGLSEVADAAWQILDEPVGYVSGRLEPAPSRALLTAVASDGTIALRSTADADGAFRLPLPAGRYTLLLRTAGGVAQTLVDVSSGRTTRAELDVPTAGVLRFRVTDAADNPLPARLILNGVRPTPDPDLGPDYRAAAGRNEVHSATGVGEIEAPPGRYQVTVTRGFEYSVVKKIVDLDAGRGGVLSVALVREIETPGWIAGDFHVHAAPSMDSEVTLTDRVTSLAAAGVEFAVATDHNHVTDYGEAVSAMALGPWLGTAVGVEITTAEWGHFNAYPLRATSRVPPYAGIDPHGIFGAVRHEEPQAVIQVNHPWMAGYGYFHRAALDLRTGQSFRPDFSFDFDAVEVINGFELGEPGSLDENLRRWFGLLNRGYRYAVVGNSDSHRVSREWAGYPRTYVQVKNDAPGSVTPEEVASSVRLGQTIVSNGPFVTASVEGAGPGRTLRVRRGPVQVSIKVSAADWIDVQQVEVVLSGEIVDVLPASEFPQGPVRLERTVEVDVEKEGWLMVVARGTRPLDALLPGLRSIPFAFTGPIYLELVDEAGRPVRGAPASDGGRRSVHSHAASQLEAGRIADGEPASDAPRPRALGDGGV